MISKQPADKKKKIQENDSPVKRNKASDPTGTEKAASSSSAKKTDEKKVKVVSRAVKKTAGEAKSAKPEKRSRTTKSDVHSDLNLVECIAEAMAEKKGIRILSMDLRNIVGASFDFFVICEATSGPQVRAIADEISEQVYRQFKENPLHTEGYTNAEWILLDFGGVVVHVFLDTVRQHYRLEELWGDSKMNYFKGEE